MTTAEEKEILNGVYLFGTGGFANRYTEMVENFIEFTSIRILGFLDHNIDTVGREFKGYKVCFPVDIINSSFDYIVIFLYKEKYDEVKDSLINDDGIKAEKIISILEFVNIIHRIHRRNYDKRLTRPSRIYDCFTFFNEIDMLRMRMLMLSKYVDYFVVVEIDKDHRGRRKPLFLKEHWDLFKEFADKIIYVSSDKIPYEDSVCDGGNFLIENFQRNLILFGLDESEAEDIICISDCDEIPNPTLFENIRKKNAEGQTLLKELESNVISLEQCFMYYYFNCVHKVKWYGSILIKRKNLVMPQICRELQYIYYMPVPGRQDGKKYFPVINNGGWHLSYFGGLDKILLKTKTLVSGESVNEEELLCRINEGLDPYGRVGKEFELMFIDDCDIDIPGFENLKRQFPQYYKENVK